MGLSAQAWVAILLAVWLVTGLLLAVLLGKLIKRGRQLGTEHDERVLAEHNLAQAAERLTLATRSPEPSSPPAYTSPRGRHHPDTSALGIPAQPPPRADLAEAAVTGPMPQVPGAWTEEVHPGRRADDDPTTALRPPRPGGRRRSDTRQTRTTARRLRDGEEE